MDMDYYHDQPNLAKLESLREKMNWEIERDRFEVLCQLDKLFSEWTGPLPNLRDIFYPEEIECLLSEVVIIRKKNIGDGQRQRIVEFVALSGYKDEPEVDKNGKPLLRRATPIHLAAGHQFSRRDAQDMSGRSALFCALYRSNKSVAQFLLRNGADPNLACKNGLTPLHVLSRVCMFLDNELAGLFFITVDDIGKTLRLDARDASGLTPLQWAVANFSSNVVAILLDRGADFSSFVFPTERHFDQIIESREFVFTKRSKLMVAIRAMDTVQRLDERGYELNRSDALMIMKCFSEYEMFEQSEDLERTWSDNQKIVTNMKKVTMNANLSLYDLFQLRPKEVEKLVTNLDYYRFAIKFNNIPADIELHLCEIITRRFFQSWALEPFVALTHFRLPLLCCDMIIETLKNKDLYHICLAAKSQSSS